MISKEALRPPIHRLEYLDGLRGIAALFVVFHHFFSAYVAEQDLHNALLVDLFLKSPLIILINGNFCVFTFFVLSGFVLSESVAKGNSTLPSRLVARYFRLTVPMVTSLIFAWVLLKLFTGTRLELIRLDTHHWLQGAFVYGANVPGVLQPLQDGLYNVYRYGNSSFNHVVWTMRKELLGSIAIYLVYRFSPKQYRWLGIALLMGVTFLGPTYLGFPIGAALRELWAQGALRDTKWSWLALATALCLASDGLLLPGFTPGQSALESLILSRHEYLYSFAAGLLVFSILTLPALRRLLGTGIPRFLGRISFALYMVHLPLITSVILWVDLHLTLPFYPQLAVLFMLLLAASISTAWLMTVVIDEPLTRRLHYVKKLTSLEGLMPWRRPPAAVVKEAPKGTASS